MDSLPGRLQSLRKHMQVGKEQCMKAMPTVAGMDVAFPKKGGSIRKAARSIVFRVKGV